MDHFPLSHDPSDPSDPSFPPADSSFYQSPCPAPPSTFSFSLPQSSAVFICSSLWFSPISSDPALILFYSSFFPVQVMAKDIYKTFKRSISGIAGGGSNNLNGESSSSPSTSGTQVKYRGGSGKTWIHPPGISLYDSSCRYRSIFQTILLMGALSTSPDSWDAWKRRSRPDPMCRVKRSTLLDSKET